MITKEDFETLQNRVKSLESVNQELMGRLNGLHQLVSVLLLEREGPTEDVVSALKYANGQAKQSTAVIANFSKAVTEQFRVADEAISWAESVVRNRGKERWKNGLPASLAK